MFAFSIILTSFAPSPMLNVMGYPKALEVLTYLTIAAL